MSGRPPTPIGWSDTDWIKKLQGDEESPLACLHINQGSFDAAADAYEEEYKMSKRTAPDIALDLDAASCSSFVRLEAAESLRQQHAEIERLRKIAAHVPASVYIKAKETAGYGLSVRSLEFDPKGFAHRPDCYGLNIDTHCMGCTMAEREAHAIEFERLKRERHHIYDLLARIHRDGGQYTAEHGVEKACDDAEAQVVAWLETINGIDALIEQARIAEREVGDMNKHTPGSWRRMGDIVAQDGTTIAIVSPRYDGDEWAANSTLIAAAPDLLEVCRRLSHVSLFAVDDGVASIIMLALDTVQKATGEKP